MTLEILYFLLLAAGLGKSGQVGKSRYALLFVGHVLYFLFFVTLFGDRWEASSGVNQRSF